MHKVIANTPLGLPCLLRMFFQLAQSTAVGKDRYQDGKRLENVMLRSEVHTGTLIDLCADVFMEIQDVDKPSRRL